MVPMLKAAGLWEKTSVKGGQYLTGRLGGVKVLVMENRDRKTDDDPSPPPVLRRSARSAPGRRSGPGAFRRRGHPRPPRGHSRPQRRGFQAQAPLEPRRCAGVGAVMAMDMEGQSPTAEQACFEKSEDLAAESPSQSKPQNRRIFNSSGRTGCCSLRRHPANESRGAG